MEQLELCLWGSDDDMRKHCHALFLVGHARRAWGLYTASAAWAKLKRARLKIALGQCERCDGVEPLQLHHITYERRFYEDLGDVVAVCRCCHEVLSGLVDEEGDTLPEAA